MNNIESTILQKLDSLRQATFNDFSALAMYDSARRTIHWKYGIGNQNNRYKQMVGRPGQDIAGLIIRHGQILVIDALDPTLADKRVEYPIMLAENLLSAIGFPLQIEDERIGALIVGSRQVRSYSPIDIQQVKKMASEISHIIYPIPNA